MDNGVPSIILLSSMIEKVMLQEMINFITLLNLLMVVLHVDQLMAVCIDAIIYLYKYIYLTY